MVELNDEELENVVGGIDISNKAYLTIKNLATCILNKQSVGVLELCTKLLSEGISKDTLFQIVDKNTKGDTTLGEEIKKSINNI